MAEPKKEIDLGISTLVDFDKRITALEKKTAEIEKKLKAKPKKDK